MKADYKTLKGENYMTRKLEPSAGDKVKRDYLKLRLAVEEKQMLQEFCQEQGMSLSDMMRKAINELLEKAENR